MNFDLGRTASYFTCAIRLSLMVWLLLFGAIGFVSQAEDGPQAAAPKRQRITVAQLTEDARGQARKCDEISRNLFQGPAERRADVARELLSQTKELTSKVPDYFIGWVQMAKAALVLDDRDSGTIAGTNLIALGVIDNRNVKILGVMAALEKRGWLPTTPKSDTDAGAAATAENGLKPSSKDLNAEDRLEFE